LRLREIFLCFASTPKTLASRMSPMANIRDKLRYRRIQETSLICTSPSIPFSSSTKIP